MEMFSSDELVSRSDTGGAVVRRKRNILFPNGVKLCNKETYEQVVHNHLQYFYLRGNYTNTTTTTYKDYMFLFRHPFIC
uniref:Uncharacterized protein n=1 Tax=Neogobius melanostomus TaxID=47308 RepID=A0A8C6SMC1_9GOBI